MNDVSALGGGIGLIVMLFLFVLAVLWFCLPFAVFGIKQKLDRIADLLAHQTDHISSLRVDLARMEQQRKLDAEPPQAERVAASFDADGTPADHPPASMAIAAQGRPLLDLRSPLLVTMLVLLIIIVAGIIFRT